MDIFPNEDADANVVLTATESWTEQEKEVSKENLLHDSFMCICGLLTCELKPFLINYLCGD